MYANETDRFTAVFKQKNHNVQAQLSTFAFGMVSLNHTLVSLREIHTVTMYQFKVLHDPECAGEESGNDLDFMDEEDFHNTNETLDYSILKYGLQGEEIDFAAYDPPDPEAIDRKIETGFSDLPDMKGIWTGLCFYDDEGKTDGLMQIAIRDGVEEGNFVGSGTDGLDRFCVSGQIKACGDSSFEVEFVKCYTRLQYGKKISWTYCGTLDTASETIGGQWDSEAPKNIGTFWLARAPAFSHLFRCSHAQFEECPARARWSFACAAILFQVKQRLWSWSFFRDRRMNRKRFLELYKRRELSKVWHLPGDTLNEEETAELHSLEQSLSPADARYYHSLGRAENRRLCIHL